MVDPHIVVRSRIEDEFIVISLLGSWEDIDLKNSQHIARSPRQQLIRVLHLRLQDVDDDLFVV